MAEWFTAGVEQVIRAKARAVGAYFGWTRFDDFAAAKVFSETRGNSQAMGESDDFGWWQILPSTAGLEPDQLLDPDVNMAAAAHLSVRLANKYGGRLTTWLGIWRGMKRPDLTDDWFWLETPASTRDRIDFALTEVGIPRRRLRERVGLHAVPNLGVLVDISRGAG
jgi:hypothetical protein